MKNITPCATFARANIPWEIRDIKELQANLVNQPIGEFTFLQETQEKVAYRVNMASANQYITKSDMLHQ